MKKIYAKEINYAPAVGDFELYLATDVDELLSKRTADAAAMLVDKQARIAELEKALDNCRLLAMRNAHRARGSDWEHIIRFCTEAGRGPSPLRADS